MSIEYLNAAFKTEVGDATQKFVLVCLADHADENGYAYPSLSTLERRCDLSRPSVVACLKGLLQKGFIVKCSNDHIPAKYLRKSNQNCYHIELEIVGVRLVRDVNQLSNLTSKAPLPDLVKDVNQCLVKQLNSNHNNKPSINHQNKNIPKKAVSKKKKASSIPDNFSLSSQVIEWGKQKGYAVGTLEKHLEYFLGYVAAHDKQYVDWDAAFMQAVRGNWAKLPANGLDNDDLGF